MDNLNTANLQAAKILIRTPNWIGDAVMCLPALRELRLKFPEAQLTLVARPWVLDVFPLSELRCRAIPYDTNGQERGARGRLQIASTLRRERFDAALLFQNAFDAALLAFLSGVPVRAGYARHGRRLLLTHPVPVPQPGEIPPHETYYYLEMLRRLGVISTLPDVTQIALGLISGHGESRAAIESRISSALSPGARLANSPLIGISAGASFGTAKRWPGERFAELSRQLYQHFGAISVFFGSKEESALVRSLLPNCGPGAVSLAGKTSLQDFMRLVAGCDLYVTNDTGTMHVAAALGVPTIAIFGPTDEHGTRPLGSSVRLIIGEAECRPCKLRHCPIDHRCMTSISVDDVFEAAKNLLIESGRLRTDHVLLNRSWQ